MGSRRPTTVPWARWALAAAVSTSVATEPSSARAGDVVVRSRTMGEGYVVLVPASDGRLLRRRRLAQYLSLGVADLLPAPPPDVDPRHRGRLSLQGTLRIRHDFGDYQRGATGRSATLVSAEDGRQVDLLTAALAGHRLGGFVDVGIGRQIDMSGLDFFAYDGGYLRIHTPVPVAFEAMGGMAVRATDLLGYPEFSVDGVPPDASARPGPRFVAGGGVRVEGPDWIDGRVGYRQVFEPPAAAAPGEPATRRVVQEFFSATARLRLARGILSPHAAVRYDVGAARLSDMAAGTELAFPGGRHVLRVLYLRTHPVFDLASIFNVFYTTPFSDVRVGYQVRLGRTHLLVRWQLRRQRTDPTAGGAEPLVPARNGHGVSAAVAHVRRRFSARSDAFVRGGPEGIQVGASAESRAILWWQRLSLDGRAFYTYADGSGSTAGGGHLWAVQLGTDTRLFSGVHLHLLVEEAGSPGLRAAFRAFGALSVDWSIRGGAR
ncbi:MAG: hypothetical protein D6705_04145 [Deltaproteobacteria bacterium]|nr:MAG: hypothetical protein D6705_04145 [Deltaproteobacteria bacterium]